MLEHSVGPGARNQGINRAELLQPNRNFHPVVLSPQRYDVVFDTVGKSSFSRCKPVMTNKGVYRNPVLTAGPLFMTLWTKLFRRKKAMLAATGCAV